MSPVLGRIYYGAQYAQKRKSKIWDENKILKANEPDPYV
jgi:hypothetical protein